MFIDLLSNNVSLQIVFNYFKINTFRVGIETQDTHVR